MSNPLDDAATSAYDDAATTGEPQVEETQPVVAEDTQPVDSSEQPQETTEPVEAFTDKVDPASLPPELQTLYKSMQGDYTRKRQEDREALRQAQAEAAEIKARLAELEKGSPAAQPEQQLSPEDAARKIALEVVEESRIKQWAEDAVRDVNSLDDRLNENHPDYEKTKLTDQWVRAKLDERLEAFVEEHGSPLGFDYRGNAKELLGEWDSYLSSLTKDFIRKQSELAKENAKNSAKMRPDVSSAASKPSGKMSIDDAIESAFAES